MTENQKSHELSKFDALLKQSGEALATFRDHVFMIGDQHFDQTLFKLRSWTMDANNYPEVVAGLVIKRYQGHIATRNVDIVDLIDPVLEPLYKVFDAYPYRNRVFERMMDFYRYETNRRRIERIDAKKDANSTERV